MDDFKWIQIGMFLMILMFMLQHSDADRKYLISRGERTLSCENLIKNQQRCINTTWTFSHNRSSAVELVKLGQVQPHKPGRLSLSENCSLTIKNLTHEDAGLYTCQQFNSSGRQIAEGAVIDLSVVTMKEQKKGDKVTFSCSVFTHEPCSHTGKWVNIDMEMNDSKPLKISEKTLCVVDLELSISHPIYKSKLTSLTCEVRDPQRGSVHLFPFSPSSAEKPATTTNSATTRAGTTGTSSTHDNKDLWWLFFIIPAVLVALVIVFVSVFRCKRRKGVETCRKEKVDGPDQDLCYTSISFNKKTNTAAQVLSDEDDQNVTYSTVTSSPSSNCDNPNLLYATVTHPKI